MPTGPPILQTKRLRLRPFEHSDVQNLYALYSDPDVVRFMGGIRIPEQAEEHVAAFAEQYAKTGFTLWAVVQKADGQFVGRVGIWPLDKTDEVELGYMFAKSHWGKGFATEASAACLDFGFGRRALESIAAIAVPENSASLRIIKKLSFKFVREDRYYNTDVLYHRLKRAEWLSSTASLAPPAI